MVFIKSLHFASNSAGFSSARHQRVSLWGQRPFYVRPFLGSTLRAPMFRLSDPFFDLFKNYICSFNRCEHMRPTLSLFHSFFLIRLIVSLFSKFTISIFLLLKFKSSSSNPKSQHVELHGQANAMLDSLFCCCCCDQSRR